jgi:hypothetical protein
LEGSYPVNEGRSVKRKLSAGVLAQLLLPASGIGSTA